MRGTWRPAGALQVYEQCRVILSAELGAEPSAALVALADRLRAAPSAAQRGRPRNAHSPDRRFRSSDFLDPPLVGRALERQALRSAYQACRRGDTRVVLVEGEAGIGKTRLVSDFLEWASGAGAEVLEGRAFEAGGRLPYQPIVDAFRSRGLDDQSLALEPVWLAELARLLPELASPGQEPPSGGDAAGAQNHLFEAVARTVGKVAEAAAERTVVVFVDDLHWADRASLDLLAFLVRRLAALRTRALVLFTTRVEAAHLGPEFGEWFDALGRDAPTARVTLGPLVLDDVRTLVSELDAGSGSDASLAGDVARFARWLHGETGGYPFYLVETIKLLVEQEIVRVVTRDGAARWEIVRLPDPTSLQAVLPVGVRERVRARLGRLPPDALSLLAAAAVLGQAAEFSSLIVVAGIDENQGLATLDILLSQRLLREIPGEEAYLFSHDKIRDVVYTEAGEARRRVFHRRALEHLAARGAPAAALVHHASAARLPRPSFDYAARAGDEAMRVFAVRDAIAYYELALANPVASPAELPEVYLQLGRAFELIDAPGRAEACYEAILKIARATDEPLLECTALNRLAVVSSQTSTDLTSTFALLEAAVAAARRSGDRRAWAETEWNLAHMGHYAGNVAALNEHGTKALALARELADEDVEARTLNVLAYGAYMSGDPRSARRFAADARQLFSRRGERALEGDCLALIADTEVALGDVAAGLTCAQEAWRIAREIDTPWLQVNASIQMALARRDLGQFSDALRAAREGRALSESLTFRPLLFLSLALEGTLLRDLGAFDRASQTHQRALEMFQNISTPIFTSLINAECCADHAVRGDWARALAFARATLAAPPLVHLQWGMAYWHVVDALCRAGEFSLAEEETNRLAEKMGTLPRYALVVARCEAVLAISQGNSDRAIERLTRARETAETIGLPSELWSIHAALADQHAARGDQGAARSSRQEAVRILRRLADGVDDDELRETLLARSPGVRGPATRR